MMDQKAIVGNVITAVIVAAVLGFFGWMMGVFEAGSTALTEKQIKAVIKQVMITDKGKTYAATLASIDGSLIAIDTRLGVIEGDIDSIEDAVFELARE